MFENLLKFIFPKEDSHEHLPKVQKPTVTSENNEESENVAAMAACLQYEHDLEVVAAITAVLSQYLEVPPGELVVRSIRKVPLWAEQSRLLR